MQGHLGAAGVRPVEWWLVKLTGSILQRIDPVKDCAAKEIRTPTPFRELPPQGSASTNFAIAAVESAIGAKPIADEECKCKNFRLIKINKEILLYKFYPVKRLQLVAK